jgi:hypothetical protein
LGIHDLLIEPMKSFGIYDLYRQQSNALRTGAAAATNRADEQPEPQPGNTEWLAKRRAWER